MISVTLLDNVQDDMTYKNPSKVTSVAKIKVEIRGYGQVQMTMIKIR